MDDDTVDCDEGVDPPAFESPSSSQQRDKAALDRHLSQSELPEVYGVARRVIEAIDKRVGHACLDIQYVADDLHYSKRTLQRRLRQQGYCFTDLRDKVRRYHGIRAVLDGRFSIDDICITLDFADRSSLTAAFKRWTGFSPRAFGKIFRKHLEP